jgi:hypothetical protein
MAFFSHFLARRQPADRRKRDEEAETDPAARPHPLDQDKRPQPPFKA